MSIAVLNNDQTKTSWSLHPVIQALLKACLDYEMSVSTKNPLDAGGMKVEVSPNPFTERLTVSVDLPENVSEVTLVLTNTMGQVMTKTESLDLSPGVQSLSIESMENLSPGVYFLSIVLNGSLGTTVKVIK